MPRRCPGQDGAGGVGKQERGRRPRKALRSPSQPLGISRPAAHNPGLCRSERWAWGLTGRQRPGGRGGEGCLEHRMAQNPAPLTSLRVQEAAAAQLASLTVSRSRRHHQGQPVSQPGMKVPTKGHRLAPGGEEQVVRRDPGRHTQPRHWK